MVTIGNDTLPGSILTMQSAASAGSDLDAPALPVIVGQAYLSGSQATASANTAKKITRVEQAAQVFGKRENSMLTANVQDALVEGAYPVYAIAPDEVSVTGEDLSGESDDTTTLANQPIVENASDITFTINSTTKTTVLYRDGDPANATPGTDEVYLNPVTGKAKADEPMGNTGDAVDYIYLDYANTFDEITNATVSNNVYLREIVDFIALLTENDTVVESAKSKSNNMESNGWFNIALAGAGDPYIDDVNTGTNEITSYSHSHDTSRLQLIHPSRKNDGQSLMGAYVGARSRIGIDSVPIYKNLKSVSDLRVSHDQSDQEDLVVEQVNPIEERRSNARIVEDYTTVTDSNTSESAWRRGFPRLVTDYVTENSEERSDPFIGDFNNTDTLNTVKGRVEKLLNGLLQIGSIQKYSLVVEEVDSTTAAIDVGIKVADPLRNFEITVSAGEVLSGTTLE